MCAAPTGSHGGPGGLASIGGDCGLNVAEASPVRECCLDLQLFDVKSHEFVVL